MTSVCPIPTKTPPICPEQTNDNRTFSQTWCDGQSMSIECPSNSNITIICAFYGLDASLDGSPCGISLLPYDPVCYLNSSFSQLDAKCTGQSYCMIYDITAFFTDNDPCIDLEKQLHIQWRCD